MLISWVGSFQSSAFYGPNERQQLVDLTQQSGQIRAAGRKMEEPVALCLLITASREEITLAQHLRQAATLKEMNIASPDRAATRK